ncbi:MAG: hypothetical protein NT106_12505 [Candidatus Sumerlaeota bacterium]|nr:hypothetical protein [Candidatus Sumerlaeota bacterium]
MVEKDEKMPELGKCSDFEQVLTSVRDFVNSLRLSDEEKNLFIKEKIETFEDVKFTLVPSFTESDKERTKSYEAAAETIVQHESRVLVFSLNEKTEIPLKQIYDVECPILFRFGSEERFWIVDQPDESHFRFCHFEGRFLIRSFSTPIGSEHCCIGYPANMILDKKGCLYILDGLLQTVHKFSPEGVCDTNFEDRMMTASPLLSVQDFDLLEYSSTLFVTDYVKGSLRKFSLDGKELGEVVIAGDKGEESIETPTGVAAIPDGRHFVIDPVRRLMVEIDFNEKVGRRFHLGKDAGRKEDFFTMMQSGPGGTLFLADFFTQRIRVYDSGGQFLGQINIGAGTELPDVTLGFFDVRSDGRVFILDPHSLKIHCLERRFDT